MNIRARLQELIEQGDRVLATKRRGEMGYTAVDGALFGRWSPAVLGALRVFPGPSSIEYERAVTHSRANWEYGEAEALQGILHGVVSTLDAEIDTPSDDPRLVLERLFERFHRVVRQLRQRHDKRPTLDVTDEYDAQDLLRSLLAIHFDDVRREEWTPSYAGASARADFLLKAEQIVLELKHARESLSTKALGEQLIVDVAKYRAHPDCKLLYCFVYDPVGRVINPEGMEADLSKIQDGLAVRVLVRPRN